jgi:hypothetical protein
MFVKKKPELVFGVKTLDSIFFFIAGYTSRAEYDSPDYTDCIDGFEHFVHGYYRDISTNNWLGLIVNNTQTQGEAVDVFFELLEAFMLEKHDKQAE